MDLDYLVPTESESADVLVEVEPDEFCDSEVGQYIDQRIEIKLNSVSSKTIFRYLFG